jgi:hypothetical protein
MMKIETGLVQPSYRVSLPFRIASRLTDEYALIAAAQAAP